MNQPLPAIESIPSPQPEIPRSFRFFYVLVIGLIILVVSIVIGAYWLGKQSKSPRQVACTMDAKECPNGSYVSRIPPTCEFAECPIQRISPTQTTNETANGISDGTNLLTIRDLQFQLPSGWWYNQKINPYFGDSWTEINPRKIEGHDYELSLFTLKAVTGKFEPTLDQSYLTAIKREQLMISSIQGELIIGKATPPTDPNITCPQCFLGRYKPNVIVAIAIIARGNNYYSFEGDITSHEKEFRQILSTFKFL